VGAKSRGWKGVPLCHHNFTIAQGGEIRGGTINKGVNGLLACKPGATCFDWGNLL
jgi:hypothetical protein